MIFVWISIMLGSTFLVIALSSIIVIADGFPITDGLIGFGIFGFISMVFFGYIRSKWEIYKQKPAIQPNEDTTEVDLSEAKDEIRESWETGRERNKEIRERLDSLPSIIWFSGILIGIVSGIAVWVLAAQGLENAMVIAIMMSMVFVTFSIMADIGRLNRTTGSQFKWWVYVTPAVIPVIGFVVGFAWLARKKQKTGSAIL